jgi:DNA processing protein
MSENEIKIWNALRIEGGLSVDSIARILDIPVFRLSPILLQMELAGMITPYPGNVYRIRIV